MATPIRIWEPGMIYHITTRGNSKEIIFREESDFEVYLMFLKDALIYYADLNYEIICFCLMSNHVHLMLKCNKSEPENFMRRLNSKYTRYFNIKYGYVGHLFQGRYFAEPITNINHLLETSRYIHMNPVKAKIISMPDLYRWSSVHYYINSSKYKNKSMYNDNFINNKIKKITINEEDISISEVMQYFENENDYFEYMLVNYLDSCELS